ncbi:MAG TPA: DUF4245 domain-containing protein [Mycobacteriales bacterium]|nr:DUF4245 domain-containing protein [Mycobacteriales bacterium]
MSEVEQTEAPVPAAQRRRQQTVRNMVWSLIPLLALIVIFVVVFQPSKQPIPTVNPQPDVNYAATRMHVPKVPSPRGLPGGWRATSSSLDQPDRSGLLNLSIGYQTPKKQYAKLVESNRPVTDLVSGVVSGAHRTGEESVSGIEWTRYKTGRGELALAAQRGRLSALVTGSADLTELLTLADSLR